MGLRQLNNNGFLISDFDKLYVDTRSLIVIRNLNLKKGSLLGSRIVSIEIPEEETLYIDSHNKMEFANLLSKY